MLTLLYGCGITGKNSMSSLSTSPDPSNFSIGKLYSTTFYKLVQDAIRETGAIVIQSTSPFVAPKSFWCIDNTLKSVGFHTKPYHNYVPSFGEWGISSPRHSHSH